MLDACAPHARWIDVFCEDGAFDGDQTRAILQAGIAKGLTPRVHANQLHHGPGVQLAVELDAASADHCTHITDDDIDALANSDTVATLLPGAEFTTRAQYPDARRLIDAGVTVALAADCNPGSSYTTNIPFCIAIAVREMHMTPDEAVRAATLGGAKALRRTDIGHLAPGPAPTPSCSKRRRTSTWPTGRAFRSSPPSVKDGVSALQRDVHRPVVVRERRRGVADALRDLDRVRPRPDALDPLEGVRRRRSRPRSRWSWKPAPSGSIGAPSIRRLHVAVVAAPAWPVQDVSAVNRTLTQRDCVRRARWMVAIACRGTPRADEFVEPLRALRADESPAPGRTVLAIDRAGRARGHGRC